MSRSPFLNSQDFINTDDALSYLNYASLIEDNKEFLRTDMFNFEFIPVSKSGSRVLNIDLINKILKESLIKIEPCFPSAPCEIAAIFRSWPKQRQSTTINNTSGYIILKFNNKHEYELLKFIEDWKNNSKREGRFAFLKEDVVADGKLTMFNTSRKPVRIYNLYTMYIMGDETDKLNDTANKEEVYLQLGFEHFTLDWENV